MPLQISYVDPVRGTPSPEAYVRIEDAQVHLAQNKAVLTVMIYHNAATAAAGKAPVVDPLTIELTQQEIGQLRAAFEDELYALLKARGDFANGVEVA